MENTYFIKTFGCAMNHSDSERFASFFESNDFSVAKKIEQANIVIINTCGVRQMAEDRVFGLVRNLKKNHPQTKIIVTGCLAGRKDIHRRMKDVDLFTEIKNFPENVSRILHLASSIRKKKTQNTISSKEHLDYLSINPKHSNNFQANVPIMTGCNNFCAYCVVPYARGRETSRPADEILAEVRTLVRMGYKMITLLGQNVNSYCDNSRVTSHRSSVTFPKLLKNINAIPGKFWITFISSHPKDMSDELIKTITKCKKVCEYVHLPIQAGNDDVLRRMNRKYTSAHYLRLVQKIKAEFKKHKPHSLFSITTDIIIGFPGETRKHFEDSKNIMKKAGYDMAYFGQYSPRPGTAAWNMKDNVSKKEKARRENVLNDILKNTALSNNKKYRGKTLEVLIEKEKDGAYYGKTRTQKNVKIVSEKKISVGTFIKVRVMKANIWNIEGKAMK